MTPTLVGASPRHLHTSRDDASLLEIDAFGRVSRLLRVFFGKAHQKVPMCLNEPGPGRGKANDVIDVTD
jgi:hypothetical protein